MLYFSCTELMELIIARGEERGLSPRKGEGRRENKKRDPLPPTGQQRVGVEEGGHGGGGDGGT